MANLYARNLVTNPRGRATSGTVTIRENLVKRHISTGTGFSVAGASLDYREEDGRYFIHADWSDSSGYITTTANNMVGPDATAGQVYTASVLTRVQAPTSLRLSIPWRNVDGSNFTTTTETFEVEEAGSWVRLSMTAEAPEGTVTGGVRLGASEASVVDYTEPLFERADSFLGYFDGDTWDGDPDFTPEWTGTPGASASRLVAPAPAGWSLNQGSGVVYYSETHDAVALRPAPFSGWTYGRIQVDAQDGPTTMSMWVLNPNDEELVIRPMLQGGSSSYWTLQPGENYRTATQPMNGTDFYFPRWAQTDDQSVGKTIYVRANLVPGVYSGPYFDGHSGGQVTGGYHWWSEFEGEADASESLVFRTPVMGDCGLYFGNAEHMAWLPAPDGEAGASFRGWGVSGGFINGGAFVRRSLTHHKAYQFNWTMKRRSELSKIEDFYGGRYGEGPFYMVMPGTHDNILPKSWSMPRTTLKDGPSLVYENPPTAATLPASSGRPPVAARYEINDEELERAEIVLPVPPGYFLHFGVHGTFTGDARIELNGMAVTPLSNTATEMTNTVIDQPGLVSVSLQGTGTATIAAMTARLTDSVDSEDLEEFVSGQGASAVEFEPDSLDITVSSAAKDYYHGTATLIEVGQWA